MFVGRGRHANVFLSKLQSCGSACRTGALAASCARSASSRSGARHTNMRARSSEIGRFQFVYPPTACLCLVFLLLFAGFGGPPNPTHSFAGGAAPMGARDFAFFTVLGPERDFIRCLCEIP